MRLGLVVPTEAVVELALELVREAEEDENKEDGDEDVALEL